MFSVFMAGIVSGEKVLIYLFIFQMENISMLERNSYLISKYSLNLQYHSLICMCLTLGLTEFIPIRIQRLPTITGYNWYNTLCYSSSAHFHFHHHHPVFKTVPANVHCIDPH